MNKKNNINDVEFAQELEAWLDGMDYERFWAEMENFDCVSSTRAHCDDQIAKGHVDRDTALSVMKRLAYHDLRRQMELPYRVSMPIALNTKSRFEVDGKTMRFDQLDDA